MDAPLSGLTAGLSKKPSSSASMLESSSENFVVSGSVSTESVSSESISSIRRSLVDRMGGNMASLMVRHAVQGVM